MEKQIEIFDETHDRVDVDNTQYWMKRKTEEANIKKTVWTRRFEVFKSRKMWRRNHFKKTPRW